MPADQPTENVRTPAARLPQLAAELVHCTEELLACIDRDEMETFTALLDRRHGLVDELRAAITDGPPPEGGWKAMFAGVLESEARLKARVEAGRERLAGELKDLGEVRTNFGRIADTYMEPDV